MTNLRARAFVPALFVQLFIVLSISQHAFSQETQRPTEKVAATAAAGEKVAVREATAGKVAAKDEACEQTPTAAAAPVTTALPVALERAGKATLASSEPVPLPSARTVNANAARNFSFATGARDASPLFDTSNVSTSFDSASGAPQTSPTPYVPLTPSQKMRRAFKSAFLSPAGYGITLVSAAITEAGEDDLPHKDTDDRVADALSRFAIRFGRRATYNLLGNGVYAVAFKQDTRYERAPEGTGTGKRIAHAVSRVFVTRGDNGKLQPNYSRFAGQLSASAISNLWEQSTPGHDRIGTDATFKRFGKSFLTGALFNVVNEFLGGIF
ncbi:MAG TPA: hypothetical protein VF656_00995 [Pyrinomonadaceae bacterium]|jgi:hypothetical protein